MARKERASDARTAPSRVCARCSPSRITRAPEGVRRTSRRFAGAGDNFHYARNIQLPGLASDMYTVHFYINPPGRFALAKHRDWTQNYGRNVMQSRVFG